MACEDFPCCGHDICPDFDESGNQINMRCTCGAILPVKSRFSICSSCLDRSDEREDFPYWDHSDDMEY